MAAGGDKRLSKDEAGEHLVRPQDTAPGTRLATQHRPGWAPPANYMNRSTAGAGDRGNVKAYHDAFGRGRAHSARGDRVKAAAAYQSEADGRTAEAGPAGPDAAHVPPRDSAQADADYHRAKLAAAVPAPAKKGVSRYDRKKAKKARLKAQKATATAAAGSESDEKDGGGGAAAPSARGFGAFDAAPAPAAMPPAERRAAHGPAGPRAKKAVDTSATASTVSGSGDHAAGTAPLGAAAAVPRGGGLQRRKSSDPAATKTHASPSEMASAGPSGASAATPARAAPAASRSSSRRGSGDDLRDMCVVS